MTTRPINTSDTDRPVRPRPPSAARVYEILLGAAERQVATTTEGQAIKAAGLEPQLLELAHKIAANAANPIADLIEDLMLDCSVGVD